MEAQKEVRKYLRITKYELPKLKGKDPLDNHVRNGRQLYYLIQDPDNQFIERSIGQCGSKTTVHSGSWKPYFETAL
jgi:hypothetical protein